MTWTHMDARNTTLKENKLKLANNVSKLDKINIEYNI